MWEEITQPILNFQRGNSWSLGMGMYFSYILIVMWLFIHAGIKAKSI